MEIRSHFESPTFRMVREMQWMAGLQVLLVDGIIRAHDERGKVVDPKELERKAVGKALSRLNQLR